MEDNTQGIECASLDETTYENNEETKKDLGWGDFPEYCKGDTRAPFVTHNHRKGIFFFHNKGEF